MASYAERLAEVDVLLRSGRGVVAFTSPDVDKTWVKDPSYFVPSSSVIETWHVYNGGDARIAYGL